MRRLTLLPPTVAFFLSGAAGLVYEVCWIRRASLVFGSTLHALSTVLAVFFLGLAIGSEAFGRRTVFLRAPLRLYAGLEVALAASALASLPAFSGIEALYGHAYRAFAGHGAGLAAVRVVLVSLVLLPPTVLMGATLPLMARQLVRDPSRITGTVAWLYALNTLGAAVGCLLTGLWLLPALGASRAIAVGAALGLAAAALAFVARLEPPPEVRSAATAAGMFPGESRRAARLVQSLLFLAGFTALAYEVLWARFLGLVVHNTVLTYTLTLAAVLVGIVLGSTWTAWRDRGRHGLAARFGALQVAIALVVLVTLLAPPALWRAVGGELGVVALLMLPAALLSGAAFPLGVRLVVEDPRLAGVGVGRVTALNTLGGIAGSLVAGFLLLPGAGLHAGLLAVTGLSLTIGLVALLALERPSRMGRRVVVAATAAAAWLAWPLASGLRLPDDFLRAPGSELVEVREGLVSNVAVLRHDGVLRLEIDRWWQGESRRTHQILAAHVPMLLHPDARRVLVVGLGVGQTADRFLQHGIERLDVAEIEPALFDLVPRHFQAAWPRDPRVRLLPEDGRSVIAHTGERYDLISVEVGLAFRPGVPAFYTVDFYRRARARLAPGGLLSQFVPLLGLPPEVVPGVLASFREVFPHALLWYNTSEALLIGVNGDSLLVRRGDLARALSRPAVRRDLGTYRHWGGPEASLDRLDVLLSGFLCGERGLAALSAGAPDFRDERPALDYATTRVLERPEIDLSILGPLRRHLDPVADVVRPGLSADTLARIARLREIDLGQMEASALVVRIQKQGLSWEDPATFALIERAARVCPELGDAARLMGQALARRGRPAEAAAWLARALEADPEDGLARRDLGWLLLEAGRTEEAVGQLAAAVEARPWDGDALNGLGAALASRGDLTAARARFLEALGLDPGNPDVRRNLERVERRLGVP